MKFWLPGFAATVFIRLAAPVWANMAVVSPQFSDLCRANRTECTRIGTHAKVSTELIYQVFEAERTRNFDALASQLEAIKLLTGAEQIQIVNRRLPLSQFFPVQQSLVFGGYALLGRKITKRGDEIGKAEYTVFVKGVFSELEDPNDIIASIQGIPDRLSAQSNVQLHQGMRNYAQEIFNSPPFQDLLTEILTFQQQGNIPIEITLSGHSLGGSCIVLAALMSDRGVKLENMNVITFGAPLFLQRGFVDRYQKLGERIVRVEVDGDMLNYEVDSPLLLVYRALGYLPLGKLLRGFVPNTKYKMLQAEVLSLSRQQPHQENLNRIVNLQLQAILERVQIHVYSYRNFYNLSRLD